MNRKVRFESGGDFGHNNAQVEYDKKQNDQNW